MATQTRVYFNTAPWTIGRLSLLVGTVLIFLFAFGVLKNSDSVSWAWVGVGLLGAGLVIG